jgi:hypothetical protein
VACPIASRPLCTIETSFLPGLLATAPLGAGCGSGARSLIPPAAGNVMPKLRFRIYCTVDS